MRDRRKQDVEGDVGGELHSRHAAGRPSRSVGPVPLRSGREVAILPPIAAPAPAATIDDHDSLRDRRLGDAAAHSFAVALTRRPTRRRAAPQPAGLDPGQLPGARVRAPPVGARRPSRAAAPSRSRSSTRRPGSRAATATPAARRQLSRLRVRHLGARRLSRRARAASSTAPACACASKAAKAEPHALELRRPARGLARRDDAGAARPTAGARDFDARRLRRARRPPGRARPLLARPLRGGRRAARVRRRRRAARFRRRAPARRHAAHLRGGDRVLARPTGRPPFERYVFLLNAVEEGHGGLEHRASTALIAPRRDLPRRAGAEAPGSRARPSRATATSTCSA